MPYILQHVEGGLFLREAGHWRDYTNDPSEAHEFTSYGAAEATRGPDERILFYKPATETTPADIWLACPDK